MRALSMKQPVPELILQGKKTLELRHWNTHFRGEFFLHASKNELNDFGIGLNELKALPHGALVGKANLVNVIKFNTLEEFKEMQAKHLANNSWFIPEKTMKIENFQCAKHEKTMSLVHQKSQNDFSVDLTKSFSTFGFILENPYRLKEPIPMKGQLNFFETGLELPKEKQSTLFKEQ